MKKPKINGIDIDYVAKLANLPLSEKERYELGAELKGVLAYISKLEEVDTESVEPIGHVTDLTNVVREDKPTPSISQDEALANAPRSHNGFFVVDAIFDEQ